MNASLIENSIFIDEMKISMIELENSIFLSNTGVVNEAVDIKERVKEIATRIKLKLIEIRDKFIEVVKKIKKKIKQTIDGLKRTKVKEILDGEEFRFSVRNGEKIDVSNVTLFNIEKLKPEVDKYIDIFNKEMTENTKTLKDIHDKIISGKFDPTKYNYGEFPEIDFKNQMKYYVLKNKNEIDGKYAATYLQLSNNICVAIDKFIESTSDKAVKELNECIKNVDKFIVKDSSVINKMNFGELFYTKALVAYSKQATQYAMRCTSIEEMFNSIAAHLLASSILLSQKIKSKRYSLLIREV